MNTKGENLRIFLNGKCVAAALSCNIHVNAAVEQVTTKDTVGIWSQNEVAGKTWDVSAEALIAISTESHATVSFDTVARPYGTAMYYDAIDEDGNLVMINLIKGQTFSTGEPGLTFAIIDNNDDIIKEELASITYTAESDTAIWLAVKNVGTGHPNPLRYDILDEANSTDHVLNMLKSGTNVEIRFHYTEGNNNRDIVANSNSYGGQAVVNDIQLTSQNRQRATYSFQCQGDGEFEVFKPTPAATPKTLNLDEEETEEPNDNK